jgi:hypothetical protein
MSGGEFPYLFRGENMWLRMGRDQENIYAEGYTGNLDLSETIATQTLTGTLAWNSTTKTVTGTGTLFASELRFGMFVVGDGGAGQSELFVVTKVVSNTSFICDRKPTTTLSGKTGYIAPIIYAVGNDRGTSIAGNVLQYPQGHYLGVGRGNFAINGSTTLGASGTLALSDLPQFALYDAATNTYTQNDVGIDQLLTPITLTGVAARDTAVTGATNATPIVITTAANHNLHNGEKVNITGVTGNTAANGNWTITWLSATTFSLNGSVGNGAYVAGGVISSVKSQMRASNYSIRVCPKNTKTLGFANPTEAIAPVTLAAGQEIKLVFNTAMLADQDGYDIYATPFQDSTTTTIEPSYNGPWYLLNGTRTSPNASVVASDLIDATHATGREAGTTLYFSYTDGEIQVSTRLLSFNNFAPKEASFVDLITGIPIYFSCLGKGTTAKLNGTNPGPVAIPSKPSNPEAIFLDKAITTAGGDYIIGEFNAKSRIYVLCQNTLQTLLLTTIEDEPVTFRSLWSCGFRNPFNVAFVKDYLYGFSTQKMVRSVAGGDDSSVEFQFATDIRDYIVDWPTGHILVAYDPRNRAVCYFYSAAERRSGYWVTIVLPFMLDQQVWNPPIVLKKTNTDFIVSGVATIGNDLTFLAGGRTSGGSISFGTYVFDGGDSETKTWLLAWNYTDDGAEFEPKSLREFAATGRFADGVNVQLYGFPVSGNFEITGLSDGTGASAAFGAVSTTLGRSTPAALDTTGLTAYTVRVAGAYTTTADRFDELALQIEGGNATT